MLRSITISIVVMAAVVGSAPARAQEDDTAYRLMIQEAVTEFDAHRFAEARALFLRAHAISPNARTLRGIGMASFEIRDYVEAYRSLSAALDEQRRALTAEQRAEVTALRDRSVRFVGIFRLTTQPTSATLTIDGTTPVTTGDGALVLAIGTHDVVARAEGYRDGRVSVQVQGGESRDLTVVLDPAVPRAGGAAGDGTAEGAGPAQSALDVPRPDDGARDDGGSSLALPLIIGGGVMIAGAVVIGIVGWGGQNAQIDECDAALERGDECRNLDTLRGERDAAAAATIALGVLGAGATVIGAVLLGSDGESGERAAGLRCGPAGLGLGCTARW